MTYDHFKHMFRNKDRYLIGFNNAIGGSDQTTDPVITRDPNNYLVPRIDGVQIMHIAITIAAILLIIILVPKALATIKSI